MGLARQLSQAQETTDVLRVEGDALLPALTAADEIGGRLRSAVNDLGRAWSRSWVGWHASMYFGDFDEPDLGESFDGEWGQFGPGWRKRTVDDVQAEVERRAHATLDAFARSVNDLRQRAEPMRRRVVASLLPICDHLGLEREAAEVAALAEKRWTIPPGDFLQMLAPGQIMSRDSQAVHEGMGTPPHLSVETVIASGQATLAAIRAFLEEGPALADRVLNRAELHRDEVREVAPRELIESQARLEQKLVIASRIAVGVVAAAVVAACVALLATGVVSGLAAAVLIVGGVLVVAGAWAWLVNRRHVAWVLGALGGVAGAIAAVDQIMRSV